MHINITLFKEKQIWNFLKRYMYNTATNLYIFRLFGQINFSFKEMKLCSARTSKVSLVNYFIFAHLCENNWVFVYCIRCKRNTHRSTDFAGFFLENLLSHWKAEEGIISHKKESTSGFTVNSQRQIIKYS